MLYSKTKKWQFGLGYSYEELVDEDSSIKGRFHSVLIETKYSWFSPRNKFRIYSGLGVVCSILTNSKITDLSYLILPQLKFDMVEGLEDLRMSTISNSNENVEKASIRSYWRKDEDKKFFFEV